MDDVKVYDYLAQEEFSCGAGAARIALEMLGIKSKEEDLINILRCAPDLGTEIDAWPGLMEYYGLSYVVMRNAPLEELRKVYDQHYIPIVRYHMPQYKEDHYAVVNEMNDETIDFNDPFYGKVNMSLKGFNEIWGIDAGKGNQPHWFIAIKNKPEIVGLTQSTDKKIKDNTAVNDNIYKETIERIYKEANINREYFIPYIAGYNIKGDVIYIDKDYPNMIDNMDSLPYIVLHESIEKSLLLHLKLDYPLAHQIAERSEKEAVEMNGDPWERYNKHVLEFQKGQYDKPMENIPKDLDLSPYEYEAGVYPKEKKLYEKMLEVMK